LGSLSIDLEEIFAGQMLSKEKRNLTNCSKGEMIFSVMFNEPILSKSSTTEGSQGQKEDTALLRSTSEVETETSQETTATTTATQSSSVQAHDEEISNIEGISKTIDDAQGAQFDTSIFSSNRTITSTKKTIDEFGNVLSEDVQTTKVNEGNSGMSLDAFDSFPTDTKIITTKRKVTTSKKTFDEFGNVIDQDVKTTTLEGNDDFESLASTVKVLTSQTKVTSIKKTVDEFGNVISEEIETSSSNDQDDDSLLKTFESLPTETKVITSKKTVTDVTKTLDEHGNVTAEDTYTTLSEGQDYDIIEDPTAARNIFPEVLTKQEKPKFTQYSGTMKFTVIRALNLEKKDYIGKSDPFVVVQYNNVDYRSKTVNNSLNPEWNFSQSLDIDGENPGTIKVQLYDEDYMGQDELGSTELDVRDLILAENSGEICINLENCKSGSIQISSVFIPTAKEDSDVRDEKASGRTQEFDRIVRKSFKKIIRTVDAEGNVMERVVEDNTPATWETSTVDVPGGLEMITTGQVTTIKKTIDEFGNVISEDVQTRKLEGEEDFDQFTRSSGSPVKKTSMKSVKKTVTVFAEENMDKNQELPKPEQSTTHVVEEVVNDDEIDWDPRDWDTHVVKQTKKISRTVHETVEEGDETFDEPLQAVKKSSVHIDVQKPKFNEITFTLHGAKNLVDKDLLGKSDPYAVISFGSQVSRTETINNDLNPTWNHEVTFKVDEMAPSHINIEFYDEDITKDDCLGNTSIEVAKIKVLGGVSNSAQKLSNCKSGDIIYSARYITQLRIPTSVADDSQDDNEDDEQLFEKMNSLGLENIKLRRKDSTGSTGSNESTDGLLRDVTHRQGSLKEKINTLKKTIRKSMSPDSLQNWDGSSEMVYTSHFDSETSAHETSCRTFDILDNEGNLIPRDGGTPWQNIKYFHTSSQPFQNISSLRSHFVTAFEPVVPETDEHSYEGGQSSVQFEESFNTFIEQSSHQVSSSSSMTQSSSMMAQFGSPPHGHSSVALELLLSDKGREVKAQLTPTSEMSSSKSEEISEVKEWIEPLISSSCLMEKQFWKDGESDKSTALSSSHASSSDGCHCSGSHSLRSPVSHIMSTTTSQTFQSLPSSPHKKSSVKQKTIVTSELFSSDEDKSRSLELVYSEPEDDQKHILSTIYRSASPAKEVQKLEKRKASFTQVKRIDRQLSDNELISGSSSPDLSKGSKGDTTFSPQFTSSPLLPPSQPSDRGSKGNVVSGFEEHVPASEFGDNHFSAVKPEADSSTKIPEQ